MKYELNQIVKTKKPHVCGSNEWKVVRTGADIKLECQGCGRIIMLQGFVMDSIEQQPFSLAIHDSLMLSKVRKVTPTTS